jgi:hypothetical protein
MPYTKLESRGRFTNALYETARTIIQNSKSPYVQGEYFGFFVNRLVKRFQRVADIETETVTAFGARNFPADVKKGLTVWADKIATLIGGTDPIQAAGDLNYNISAVLWGITGDMEGIPEAGYGYRAYLKGFIQKIRDMVQPLPGNAGDAIMSYRRHLVVKAVLDDVLEEWYRVKTADYEERKKAENGDLWENGKLKCSP